MKRAMAWMALAGGMLGALAACGLPREAGTLAHAEAGSVATAPASDADVRAALLQQAAAWRQLSGMLGQQQVGGIGGVDGRFAELVNRATALAARQQALIEQGTDDLAEDRATLAAFRALWQQTDRYLNP